ncbi:hypothetical protein GCM10010317_017710 [Streptomyces mirabilis]|nr:hypothetical protein GCM10010317_017710 [Streptomyces mirabilis]
MVERVVGRHSDVFRAYEIDGVIDVPHKRVDGGVVEAEEDTDTGDADDPARGGALLGLFVADVAGMLPHRAHA